MKNILLRVLPILLIPVAVTAQTTIEYEQFATGFDRPIDIVHADDSMLYIVEQEGVIHVVDPSGSVLPTPYLDISDIVESGANEQGLLGLTFHPSYPDSPYCYVNYIDLQERTQISRFTKDDQTDYRADRQSERFILEIDQPFTNHNAGDLAFGPDGYLYIPIGDGGSGGDPLRNAQNPLVLLGKILRIDVDGGNPYVIPEDNPFASDDGTLDEIWAIGLRNPWRIDFDPATGDLYIADVGQSAFEEINFQSTTSAGGENYGWRCYEGDDVFNTIDCPDPATLTYPAHAYPHIPGAFCTASISGGVVYRGSDIPALDGLYLFADYCTGMMGGLRTDGMTTQVDTVAQFDPFEVASFGRDRDGEVYFTTLVAGDIYKITDATVSSDHIEAPSDVPYTIQDDWLTFTSAMKAARLFNATGQLVAQCAEGCQHISTSRLSPGVYVLRMLDERRWRNYAVQLSTYRK